MLSLLTLNNNKNQKGKSNGVGWNFGLFPRNAFLDISVTTPVARNTTR